jgi:hypothetical protein
VETASTLFYREAFIITLHPDDTFVLLIDENGDHLVLDDDETNNS